MLEISENVVLAPYTTFRLGGRAKFFARIKTAGELLDALSFAREKKLNVFILGGGSNVLFDDAGFDGLVIKIEIGGIEFQDETVIAGAGEDWDALVERAIEKNLWGIENLSGIPGTAGAAPMQNIGAYGQELSQVLLWLEALDTANGEVRRFENKECGFGYRASRFKQETGRFVVLRAAVRLRADGEPNLSYRDLFRRELRTLPEIRRAVLEIRSSKFPDLAKEGTAGSFFLNPVVSPQKAAELAARFPGLPQFPAQNGTKISLAWLLDHGLRLKGERAGGARVFERQPLVIVADKNASAHDTRALAERIKKEVREKTEIELEEEVRVL